MSRIHILLIIICLVVVSTGCRNRCKNPFGTCYADGTTIAPPPTGSLIIPSVARNPAAAPPGTAPRAAANPYSTAPLPGPVPGVQPGFGPNGGPPLPPNGPNAAPSTAPSTFVETRPAYPGNQYVSVQPGTGTPFTNSTNYRTTQTDERADSTRLPLSDASLVRAPSAYTTGQAPAVASYPMQQTHVAQNGAYPSGPARYGTRGVLVNQPAAPSNVYRGQAVMVGPQSYPGSSQPTVLAQSTAIANPNSSQHAWGQRTNDPGNLR